MKRHTLLFTYGLLTTAKRFHDKSALTYEISEKPQQEISRDKQTRAFSNPTGRSMNFKKLEENHEAEV